MSIFGEADSRMAPHPTSARRQKRGACNQGTEMPSILQREKYVCLMFDMICYVWRTRRFMARWNKRAELERRWVRRVQRVEG